MAVVLIFRVAIAVTPVVVRACQTNACDANQWANTFARFYGRFIDPSEDPAALSADMSADIAANSEGGFATVTDFTGTFEMRKLQVRFQRTPPGGVIEDIDVITMHFLKAPGGTPTNSWLDSDYTTLETALDTWWASLKLKYISTIQLGQYRWYASGPEWDITPAPYNPARRITERSVVGTAAGTSALPPQCAMSITQRTASRPTWGRFYLPAPGVGVLATEGIILSSAVTSLAADVVTMFNTARAANLLPVVFTRARGEYTRRDGTVLPAKAASCHTVDSIQVDNIFDVIRSRRWATVTQRVNTALT